MPDVVIARVQRTLPLPPKDCFERFCAIEHIPEWVERVTRATVRTQHPDGRAAEVDFAALRPDGIDVHYSLVYAYDREGLRVSWRPREGEQDAVMGYAAFDRDAEDDGRCLMTYALQEGYAWDAEHRDLREVTEQLADAFARFIGH